MPASPRTISEPSRNRQKTIGLVHFPKLKLAYPKKRHWPAAERAWKAVQGDLYADEILAGVERWKQSEQWQGGRIEDPSTFLNQRQWEDSVPEPIRDDDEARAAREFAQVKARLFPKPTEAS